MDYCVNPTVLKKWFLEAKQIDKMYSMISKLMLLLFCVNCVASQEYDDVDLKASSGVLMKMLREMVNQTKADTLNLPANATSIRENIVDTFSCDNRTYGYYADVDNECQVFHVCLPSQTTSGRNITYRWSFICPGETVFNQEVLVCTRPRDAIDCADSPSYYDLNMEMGKVPKEDTQEPEEAEGQSDPNKNVNNNQEANPDESKSKKPSKNRNKIQKRKPTDNNKKVKKQNLVVEAFFKDAISDGSIQEDKEVLTAMPIGVVIEETSEMEPENIVDKEVSLEEVEKVPVEDTRMVSERRYKRKGRKISRGTFRFKADAL